jgi:hypothetical protein
VTLLTKLKQLLARSGFGSFERSDQLPDSERTVENDEAWAQMASGGDQFPPNYVPPADEGRPRH